MAKKFYVVRKGHKVGIFETWDECKQSVEGFSGAEYKSFGKFEDAEAYLNNEDLTQKNTAEIIKLANESDRIIAYIDGSYDEKNIKYSFGCVIVTPKGEIIKESGCGDDPDGVLIRNVAGELQGALYVVKWAVKNGYKAVEIRHDYEGIAKWALGEWKAKSKISKVYIEEIGRLKELVNISFTKINAHTNDSLNDDADKLAKEALITGKKAKVNKGVSWFTAEGITTEDLKTIISLVLEEINNVNISESDISYGKRIELSIPKQERLVIQHFTDKNGLSIQGKPQKLFSIIVTYITELVDVEKIPELFNNYFKMEISKDNIDTEFKSLLPNAYGRLPQKIDRVLHQAVYNLNINGDVYDATFLTEPALRGLEGHLKLILKNNGIELREKPEDKHDKFFVFEKSGEKYKLKQDYIGCIQTSLSIYIGKCYTFFFKNRNTLSHWDDPTQPLDTTRLISNVNIAHTLIKETLTLIDEYYKMI